MTIDEAADSILQQTEKKEVVKILKQLLASRQKGLVLQGADQDLQTWLREGFLKMNDEKFSNYPKEALAIKQLIKKAKYIATNGDVKPLLEGMIKKLIYKKHMSRSDFWKDAALLPSTLNQRWDAVYAITKEVDVTDNPVLQTFLEVE